MFEWIVVVGIVAIAFFVATISRSLSEQTVLIRELISAAKSVPPPSPEPTWPMALEARLDRILWKLGFEESEYLAAKRKQAELAADAEFDPENVFPAYEAHAKISGSYADAREYVERLNAGRLDNAP